MHRCWSAPNHRRPALVHTAMSLRAYSSWKEFARTVAKAVLKEQARLIRKERQCLISPDDHKVTAPPVEPYAK